MIITRNVGGCSGPIWGTGFMRAGALSKDRTSITLEDLDKMLTAAIEGIQKRGGAQLGDKTLLDAVIPIRDIVHEGAAKDADPREVLRQATRSRERGDRAHEAVGREARPAAVHGRPQRGHAGSGHRRDRDDAERHLRQVRRAGADLGPLINSSNPGGITMKKFVNDPAKFVPEMLEGIALANPGKLKYEPKYNIIYRADRPKKDRVSVIQGSGSGHEPAHVMAVGPGMLDAASPGNVFAAPPMDYCLECIKLMNSPKGVLVLINNYQGDRMNWDMAIEMAQAEGIDVKSFIIDDDVAVQNSSYTIGRRGVAGNFFVIKACGAAAEKGASLDDLLKLAAKVNANVRSMGVALTSCTPPAKGKPIFEIGDDEMEVGVGIHGEPGRRRDKLKPADAIVDEIFDAVSKDLPFKKGDRVALMINGLGGTPPSELYVLYRKAALRSNALGLEIVRNYVGNYCTSLEMAGASLTLLKLDKEIEDLLAAPAEIAVRVF